MFYWQAGVITYLREQGYELSSCSFAGASAGALTATLTATKVDFYEATELALKLAADAGVWDRRRGLQNLWGPLIEEWLDMLLPESIESVEGRLSLLGKLAIGDPACFRGTNLMDAHKNYFFRSNACSFLWQTKSVSIH
jgi:predicted acylesterase/phospholipase RssA